MVQRQKAVRLIQQDETIPLRVVSLFQGERNDESKRV